MKKILFLFAFFIAGTSLAQQSDFKSAFLEKWQNSKNYLLEMAELMPEGYYDFKPTERQRSFKEQLLHIRSNINWLSSSIGEIIMEVSEDYKNPKTKKELIATLDGAFNLATQVVEEMTEEDLAKTMDFFAGPKSHLQILNLMQDHVTHHRGQIIVYLNLKNIEPPRYVGW